MANTALLVIDAQVGIIEGPSIGPVYKKEECLKVMKSVIEKARNLQVPIIYIHKGSAFFLSLSTPHSYATII